MLILVNAILKKIYNLVILTKSILIINFTSCLTNKIDFLLLGTNKYYI